MQDKKISQSLLKSLFNYQNNSECGIKIYENYINGVEYPSSDAMEMGNWFEYMCTQQLPRSGRTPVAETVKSGDLTTAYKRMTKQINRFNDIIQLYKIKILHTGYVFNDHKYGTGIADIIAEWNGKNCVIDIKTTSKIDDKWSPFGWGDEKFEYVDSPNTQAITIQAVQYTLLAKEKFGDCDFYFFVFSTTEDGHAKIFKVDIDDSVLDRHEDILKSTYKYFNTIFCNKTKEELAVPELKRCESCILKTNCQYAVNVPTVKTIQVY